jgi:putative OPT family oligopeptide transporter
MSALFGILFGAANAYLGLVAGLTISTSIPVAIMTVAAFRLIQKLGVKNSILEANISQTVGSASSSLASGIIFTLQALFLWQMDPALLQMSLLAICGGMIGVLFMIPLRKFLICNEHGNLPYPEGTACAEVLVANEVGGSHARNVFLGIGAGALFKFIVDGLHLFKSKVVFTIPFLKKGELGCNVSSALFGVGMTAVAVLIKRAPEGIGYAWAGGFAQVLSLILFIILGTLFWKLATGKS